MRKKKNIKLATTDGKSVKANEPLTPPRSPPGGEPFTVYSLQQNLKTEDFAENWAAFFGRSDRSRQLISNPRRAQRQNGKIFEAQKFRRYQGIFLKTRLHAIEQASTSAGLKWWFATYDRIWLHHVIMSNYYFEDRPTSDREIMRAAKASPRTMADILKTAIEIGSLDPDVAKEDKRMKVYYPSRGLVSDTDNFFHSEEDDELGVITYMSRLMDETYGEEGYRMFEYQKDVREFYSLMRQLMEKASEAKKDE
jgi:hypothetical protein